jgi:hypothetical protein
MIYKIRDHSGRATVRATALVDGAPVETTKALAYGGFPEAR